MTTWTLPPPAARSRSWSISGRHRPCGRPPAPRRGGHAPALEAGRMVYAVREQVSAFFRGGRRSWSSLRPMPPTPSIWPFRGWPVPAGTSYRPPWEHNSVCAPSGRWKCVGVRHTLVQGGPDSGAVTAARIAAALEPETCLVACTHVSNVTGTQMPVEEIGALCRARGIPFLVDASQVSRCV